MAHPASYVKELYIMLLKAKSEKIDFATISRRMGIGQDEIKACLGRLGDVRIVNNTVVLDDVTWASLAEHAVREGVPLYEIARSISWQRFEALTEEALIRHGFETIRDFRFKSEGRRWQIDVVGLRGADLVCFDCKQWKAGGKSSALLKSAMEQMRRVEALSHLKTNPKGLRTDWNVVKIYPALITLLDTDRHISAGCFIVPVLRLNHFLDEFYDLRGLIKPFKTSGHESERQLNIG